MSRKSNKEQHGFTIAELLISTVIFSVLLVGILSAFIKISDLFYKGITMSKTQEAARTIVQSISDDIQFTTIAPDNVNADYSQFTINGVIQAPYTPQQGVFCVGNHRYSFQIGVLVDNSANYGLKRDTVEPGPCSTTASVPATTVKMLGPSTQLNKLGMSCINRHCNVKIHVIYYGGDNKGLFYSPCTNNMPMDCPNSYDYSSDQSLAPDAQCTGSIESTDLCATVDYDSTVLENTQ